MQFLVFDTVNNGQTGFHCFELKGSKISVIASCWTLRTTDHHILSQIAMELNIAKLAN